RAKLLNLLWTLDLAHRLGGTRVTANAVNPGMAWTPGIQALNANAVPGWRLIWPFVRLMQKSASAEKAARGPVHLASSVSVAGLTGAFFDELTRKSLPERFLDRALQERVWQLGRELAARRASVRPAAA